jgi:hypothetical protein
MHTIRLRGPWQNEPLEGAEGTVRCTRHFNKPTGLDGGERVWLVIDGIASAATISLNGAAVGQVSHVSPGDAPTRFDITPLLLARSKIEIDLQLLQGSEPLACLGEVRLEIASRRE